MAFKMKYKITADLLPKGTNRRGGKKINKVLFTVGHDTGNPGSTAKQNVTYYKNSPNISASAHIFSDDVDIIECIPALLSAPEKAWHVLYNVTTDNEMYGDDANDAAIGVEMCWGKGIDSAKSYARYVWVLAYICYKFGLDPKRDIVGHEQLDPKRKIDPSNGLKYMGKTYNQLIIDVVAEYKECTGSATTPTQSATPKVGKTHKVVSGDTLWAISKKYNKTVGQLKTLNPEIDVMALQVGSVLVIDPTVTVPKPAAPKPSTPKVDSRLEEYLKHPPIRPYPGKALTVGSKGKDVEAVQRAIGASVDGIFGKATASKVKAYQKKFPFLGADGIVGKNTWNVMF